MLRYFDCELKIVSKWQRTNLFLDRNGFRYKRDFLFQLVYNYKSVEMTIVRKSHCYSEKNSLLSRFPVCNPVCSHNKSIVLKSSLNQITKLAKIWFCWRVDNRNYIVAVEYVIDNIQFAYDAHTERWHFKLLATPMTFIVVYVRVLYGFLNPFASISLVSVTIIGLNSNTHTYTAKSSNWILQKASAYWKYTYFGACLTGTFVNLLQTKLYLKQKKLSRAVDLMHFWKLLLIYLHF